MGDGVSIQMDRYGEMYTCVSFVSMVSIHDHTFVKTCTFTCTCLAHAHGILADDLQLTASPNACVHVMDIANPRVRNRAGTQLARRVLAGPVSMHKTCVWDEMG